MAERIELVWYLIGVKTSRQQALDDLLRRFDSESPDGRLAIAALTVREGQVLELKRQGLRDKEIADQMYIAPCTVKCHVKNVARKIREAEALRNSPQS